MKRLYMILLSLMFVTNAYAGMSYKKSPVSDTAYDSSWDGDTVNAPSKNAVYDKFNGLNSMVYPGVGIALSTGSEWGSSITNNSANWNTAYGWGNHASAGYLTSQTSHTDVVQDGDFSSQGIMLRGASSGTYSILTDNSAKWNTFSLSKTILVPVATDDYPLWRVPYGVTITSIHGLAIGGTNVVFGIDEADANGVNAVAVDADITATTATGNANDDGSLTNPSIDANDYLNLRVTSVSGTVTSFTITVDGTIN